MASETEDRTLDSATLRAGVGALLDDEARGFYLVAEDAGGPAGALMVTFEWSDWRNAPFWWIQSVYVAPDLRGRGVYQALHARVESEARSAGCLRTPPLRREGERPGAPRLRVPGHARDRLRHARGRVLAHAAALRVPSRYLRELGSIGASWRCGRGVGARRAWSWSRQRQRGCGSATVWVASLSCDYTLPPAPLLHFRRFWQLFSPARRAGPSPPRGFRRLEALGERVVHRLEQVARRVPVRRARPSAAPGSC